MIDSYFHYLPLGDFFLEGVDEIDGNPEVLCLCQGYPITFIRQVSLLKLMNSKWVVMSNVE